MMNWSHFPLKLTEAVLNSQPLTYINAENLNEPLTPSHLLVGFRILTTATPDLSDQNDKEDDLPCKVIHLKKVFNNFWKRWRKEYLLELREHHRSAQRKGCYYDIQRGEI